MKLSRVFSLVAACALAGSTAGAASLPEYFSIPKHMAVSDPSRVVVEGDASASFRVGDRAKTIVRRGKRYFASLVMQPDDDQHPKEIWAAAKPQLASSGWQIVGETAGPPLSATLFRKIHGAEVWATFTSRASGDSAIEIIEGKK